eukprot:IDg21627t1
MAIALLNILPDRFDSFTSALDSLGNESKVFTFDFVKIGLLHRFIGSGCSTHMMYNCTLFSSYSEQTPGGVKIGNEATTQVIGKGNIIVELKFEDKRHIYILKDFVLFY